MNGSAFYHSRIQSLAQEWDESFNAFSSIWGTLDTTTAYAKASEIKAHAATIERTIVELKRQAQTEVAGIRTQARAARMQVRAQGLGFKGGMLTGLVGRRNMGMIRATQNQEISHRQAQAIAPYDAFRVGADEVINVLREAK